MSAVDTGAEAVGEMAARLYSFAWFPSGRNNQGIVAAATLLTLLTERDAALAKLAAARAEGMRAAAEIAEQMEWPLIGTMCHPATQYDAAAAILAAAQRAEAAMPSDDNGWQPIDTAPRNNRDILIVNANAGVVRLGFWDTARGGLWSLWPGREPASPTPTHWRPLPKPPGGRPTTEAGDAE